MSSYCTGTFVGQRILDSSIMFEQCRHYSITFSLAFTPTKQYPSLFGAGFYEDSLSSSVVHGHYAALSREASFIEMIDGKPTYEYQCVLTVDKAIGSTYIRGTWRSLLESKFFGIMAMVHEPDSLSSSMSGIWTGEAQPAVELAEFFVPINPIRWCATFFRTNENTWRLFGSGYFNDSADIPNQPLVFFSLDGKGTLDDMNITKTYATIKYSVEYRGKVTRDENDKYTLAGSWSNAHAGSYGSFQAEQCQLNPTSMHRLDICLCAVCTNILHPGDNRWFCAVCHFSTCPGCNLNTIAISHPHKLVPHILPTQDLAQGSTSMELIKSALKIFELSPFIGFRSRESENLVWLTYGDISHKCYALAKYWKQFILNTNQNSRPFIVLLANTSPAYIASLLAGLLCQAVLVPTNPTLQADALKHVLSTMDPSILVVGEEYLEKIWGILEPKSNRLLVMSINEKEEQFQSAMTDHKDSISLTVALEIGGKLHSHLLESSCLSNDAISAILSTSGSTGYPKGAIFTEDLLVPKDAFTLVSPFIRIDYQPFDPALVVSLMSTIQYGSSRGITNLKDMWSDIKDIRPTSLGLSPAVWTFLYKNYLEKLSGNVTEQQRQNAAAEMRQSLGGRVITGTSGGGSTSASVLSFVRNVLKIDVVDMYGCRECGNITRDGVLYPGLDVKLIPVSDLGLDGETEGEICVHSPRMISGYWAMDKHSSFIDIDGKRYYRTGDIGILNQRVLKVLDRSGTMIKNAMADWISPVKIENILEQLPEITTAFVIGESSYSYVAVIVCPSDIGKALNEPEMLQLIRFYGAHCGLRGPEIPQCVYIERDITWNEQNSLMKEKKCRAALLRYYSQVKVNLFREEQNTEQTIQHDLSEEFILMLESILSRPLRGKITGKNTFLEIGADSLAVARLCKMFHERNVPLVPTTVYNYHLDHLQEMFRGTRIFHDEIILDINWTEEYKIPERIKSLIKASSNLKNQHILITGCTGFLGPLLVFEVFEKTQSNVIIYCLIRASNIEHAQQRLRADLQKCGHDSIIDWSRIRCIIGDVSKESFGLEQDIYNELTQQIGMIYHNASAVNLQVPYRALKETNVVGTLNCVEFAIKSNARLIYTSSTASLPGASDSQQNSNGWVILSPNDMNHKDGYGQSKVVAERILQTCSKLGMDIVIVRPCTISGDTQTGYSNRFDFINLLLLAEFEMGCIVEHANIELHPIPVDSCSKAIVALSMHPESRGKCFNFYGNGVSISHLHNTLIQHFPDVLQKRVQQQDWQQYVLNNLPENSPAWPMRQNIADMIFTHDSNKKRSSNIPIEATKEFLKKKCNLDWFHVTEANFIKSIEYLIKDRFFTR